MNDARSAKADALLETTRAPKGGALKVFLGAAPGVGKTYAMLTAARDLQRQGIDVVVGLVETHGRAETAALLDGLELLPRRSYAYREREIAEFDLDAALARRPQVILVDELAHRNAPGARHSQRCQDIVELLDAGIDVYTTVNIQHLESLNDVVRQITGVRVSETVPDAVLDRARDLVLVDLPPRELIERLQHGKVYLPEQAAAALQRFFSPTNLTALRELAVQQVADRVDADLREQFAAQGSAGVPIRRRVMIAIDGLGNSEYLVRAGRRIAERRGAPWTAVYVDRGGASPSRQNGVEEAFALARRLGGDTVVLHGAAVVDQLLDYAQRSGASTIVIGRTRERPIARMVNRTLTQQLLQRAAHLELTILGTPIARAESRRQLGAGADTARPARELGFALGVSGAAMAVGWMAESTIGLDDLSLVFITAVVLVASTTRKRVAVLAAVLCSLGYNFFFTQPRHTFFVDSPHDVVTVSLFLLVALICGQLASRLRQQVLALRAANGTTVALQALSQRLAAAADEAGVLQAGVRSLHEQLGLPALAMARDGGTRRLAGPLAAPASVELDAAGRAAADWCVEHGQPAGRSTDTLQAVPWWFLPLRSEEQRLGVIGLRIADAGATPVPESAALARMMVDEIAQALARVRLVGALESARVQGETERLRAALLASVSHDLRSPLSSIIGSAESLSTLQAQLPERDRIELAEGILQEGRRLDRYIQNLLDMTRLGHGSLKLDRDWVGLDEIFASAGARLAKLFPELPLQLAIPSELPLLWVHPALIEQALFNILENAARFSPPGEAVRLRAELEGRTLRIDVIDAGPGIPEHERQRIFDIFYSVERGDRGGQGTGLGLTICQGMIGAHGGSVEALPGEAGRGTTIRITLPLIEPPPAAKEAA
jgi:two-component system, OmpR family, sensor histidine kinase KdpD